MASGFVEKLLTFRAGYDPSIDVQIKACNVQIIRSLLELTTPGKCSHSVLEVAAADSFSLEAAEWGDWLPECASPLRLSSQLLVKPSVRLEVSAYFSKPCSRE